MKAEIKTLKANSSKGFKILAGINRPIVPSHVTKISASISKMGIIRPVIVSTLDFMGGDTYIIDGQHLYHGCLRLNIDIPYISLEIKSLKDLVEHLALLNNSSKSWTLLDYVTAWKSVNKEYEKLYNYYNTYDLQLQQIVDVLMNNSITVGFGGNSSISRILKNGTFKISEEKRALFILDCVTDTLKVIKRMDRASNSLFIQCYVHFLNTYPKYNHTEFIKRLKENKDKFNALTQDPERIQENPKINTMKTIKMKPTAFYQFKKLCSEFFIKFDCFIKKGVYYVTTEISNFEKLGYL